MPKIINAYAAGENPLTDALSGFAKSFGANTPTMEFARQKAYGTSRDNQSYQTLQDAERAGGVDLNSGDHRAAIVGMASPKEFFEAQRGINAMRYGAGDQRATNAYMGAGGAYGSTVAGTRESEGNRVNIENMRTQRLLDAEKYKFDNTFEQTVHPETGQVILTPRTRAAGLVSGKQAELDNQRGIEDRRTERLLDAKRFEVNNTPELVQTPDGPRIARRSEAFGQVPVLDKGKAEGTILQQDMPTLTPEQRGQAGGYGAKNPSNIWVYKRPDGTMGNTIDGKTDAQTGQPITGPAMKLEGANTDGLSGNHAIDQKLLEARNNKDRAVMMIDRLHGALSQPNADQSVGYLGTVARTFNDLRAQSEATVRLFGGELKDQAFAPGSEGSKVVDGAMNTLFGNPQIVAKAQQLGIDSAVIRSQVQDLAYMYAKTMDPSGRVGVDDIRRASETVGAMLQDPTAGRRVLEDLKQRVVSGHDIVERNTRAMYPGVRSQSGAPAAPTPPSATGAAPVLRYDNNGNRVQ